MAEEPEFEDIKVKQENEEEPLPPDQIDLSETEQVLQLFKTVFHKKNFPEKTVLLESKTSTFQDKEGKRKSQYKHSFIVATGLGIHIWDTVNGEKEGTHLVSDLILEKASKVLLKGFDNLNEAIIFKLDTKDEQSIVVDLQSLTQTLNKYVYVNRSYEKELGLLIRQTHDDIESMYYAPGYWVEGNKIKTVIDAGYNAPWKEKLRWIPNIENDSVPEIATDVKVEALNQLREFVKSYMNPAKPSAVLCYAIFAPLAQYFKKKTSYFPHLIIQGLQSSGKSTLLDMLRLMYSVSWNDPTPKGEFQARKLLAQTTIPALVDEMRSVFNPEKPDALEILHTAATTELLRTAGSSLYGGVFLAIRPVIGCTNTDLSLVPFQADKFISITISKTDAIDTRLAEGKTPRMLKPELRLAISVLFNEALKLVENDLETITCQFVNKNREEIRKALISYGWAIWKQLFDKYGVEEFPKAFDTEEEQPDATPKYHETFTAYIQNKIQHKHLPLTAMVNENMTETLRHHKQDFERTMCLYVYNDREEKYQLVMKPSYLGHFSIVAKKEYNLEQIGENRLAEMLDMKISSYRPVEGVDKKQTYFVFDLPKPENA